jgi:phage repressor protein C with HTH and peptisase S24 domain
LLKECGEAGKQRIKNREKAKKQGSGEAKKGKSEAEENGKSEEAEKQRVERESKSTGRLKIKNISLNRKTALPLKIPSLCCENDAFTAQIPATTRQLMVEAPIFPI